MEYLEHTIGRFLKKWSFIDNVMEFTIVFIRLRGIFIFPIKIISLTCLSRLNKIVRSFSDQY